MKRKLLLILSLCLIVSSVIFAACDKDKENPPVHEHSITHHAANAATCTDHGNIGYWECSSCGKYFSDNDGKNEITDKSSVITPLVEHSWDNGVITTDPTCTEEGERTYTCTVCSGTKPEKINKANHTISDWIIESAATCVGVGERYKECTVCQIKLEREIIPATEHTYGDAWVYDDDYHWHEAICEHTDEVSDKDKHSFDNYKCSICGYELLEYELNNDGQSYSVIGIGGYSQAELEIPKTYNNKPITSIGRSAFYDCGSLESIIIPDSVTSIGDEAFAWCSSLESIIIPDSVTSIGDCAFYRCSSLESIIIPDSVTSIGYEAFGGCSSLESITIPDSVTSIDDGVFVDCSSLESITVSSNNKVYHSKGNCIIETASKTLIVGCKASIIPTDGSVTSIGDMAFGGCSSLESITIPDSVTSIGDMAFVGCSGLESITIPDRVESIGDMAFAWCSSLESIIIPDRVESIGDMAFYACSSLESITIPDRVESIGDMAFGWCTSLSSVFYKGTAEEWSNISIGYGNDELTFATVYYYSEPAPTTEGNYWHYDEDGITPVIWEK